MPPLSGAIKVTDRPERRIRKPIDLLRCVTSFIEIVALVVAGVAASATTTGAETDIIGASARLPQALRVLAPTVALFAILIIPVALAVRQVVRRQVRRLAEAVATGVLAAAVAAVINAALRHEIAARLYDAIIMARPGASHAAALDPYLAGLVAYATIIGLSGRPGWRNALWLAVGVYGLVHLAATDTTLLSFLLTLLVGRTIGLAVRYAAGSPSLRPSAAEIASALTSADRKVTEIRWLGPEPRPRPVQMQPASRPSGPGRGTTPRRRAPATGWMSPSMTRISRRPGPCTGCTASVLLRGQVSRGAPLSADRTVERRALLSYAADESGAPTPRLRAVVRVGPEATVLAHDHYEGTTLAQRNPGCTDAELRAIWDAVNVLHQHRVTHRSLTADRILLTDRRPGDAARSRRRRRGGHRPADPPRRGPAAGRARALRRAGAVGRPGAGEGGRR